MVADDSPIPRDETTRTDEPPLTGETRRTDDLLSALARERHRNAIRYFEESGAEVASRADLVDHLVGLDGEPDDPVRIEAALVHVVLPKLADVGVVEHDPRSGAVRYRGHPSLAALLARPSG